MKVILIGICGPSTSGKSTLCKSLSKKYKLSHIEVDSYTKNDKEIPSIGKWINWELPKNYRFKELLLDLKKLKRGKTIKTPIAGKIKSWKKIKPTKIILIDGYYLFYYKKIREILDVKIYINLSTKEAIKRRMTAHKKYWWGQEEYVKKVLIPMYKKYGVIQKKYADHIINGELPLKQLEKKIEKIIKKETFIKVIHFPLI